MSLTEVWAKGGKGAVDLADKVVALAEKNCKLTYMYDDLDPLKTKIENVCKNIYGAAGVEYEPEAEKMLKKLEDDGYGTYPVCIAKTQYSLSDDPKNLLCDEAYNIHIREVVVKNGAEFVVVKTGKIFTMPGLPKVPAAENIRVNDEGLIEGIF